MKKVCVLDLKDNEMSGEAAQIIASALSAHHEIKVS